MTWRKFLILYLFCSLKSKSKKRWANCCLLSGNAFVIIQSRTIFAFTTPHSLFYYSSDVYYQNVNRKTLISCCCVIHRKRRQIRKRKKVLSLVVDWKQTWKMTLLTMVVLMVASAMNMMTSCDKGSLFPFPFPLCPDTSADMQHYPFHATCCHLENWTMCQPFPVVTDSA